MRPFTEDLVRARPLAAAFSAALASATSPRIGLSPADWGWASTRTARANSDSGMAMRAPNGPRSADWKMTETRVGVMFRFTVPATNRGWMTDWMGELITP